MTRFSIICTFILTLSSSISGNVLVPRDLEGCGGSLFVDDAVVIDAPLSANCKWKIQTDEKHILVFTVVHNGNFKQVEEFLSIHDGFEIDSSVLLFENQRVHEVSNKKLPETVYTTGPVAEVRFKKTPTYSGLTLKIQRAVSCPFNLGVESQCGRLVDETSCYCATFTKRDQVAQTNYCDSNAMKLLVIESYAEELAIQAAWGTSAFWTSGSDKQLEGKWIWESTGLNLYPGYANWADAQPDNSGDYEDCLHINFNRNGRIGWNDYSCSNLLDAICENHA